MGFGHLARYFVPVAFDRTVCVIWGGRWGGGGGRWGEVGEEVGGRGGEGELY
jgi:hypothetical protein